MSQDDKNSNQDKNKMDVLVEGHNYDDIQEFNNPAPFWWQLFFYISIIWAIGYMIYYLAMGGPSSNDELAAKMEQYKSQAQSAPADGGVDEAKLAAAASDPKNLELGAKVFAEKCLACHAADGGGLVGPNLTDDYWIHGKGTLKDIYTVVYNGVLDKGMLAWGSVLKPEELQAVVIYVKSLHGKPVANAKAPQGELVK